MTVTAGTPNDAHEVGCSFTPVVCAAPRHGTINAYKNHGCRCPLARRAWSRYMKNYRLRRLRNQPAHIDATGTRRRIHALQAIGWTVNDIGAQLGCTGSAVWQLCRRALVHRSTAAKVRELYRRLADTSGESEWARTYARHQGWLPPLWWDDDTIDDPNHDPAYTDSRTAVDWVVVDRLVTGVPGTSARRNERQAAFHRLRAAGHSVAAAGAHLHLSWSTAGEWESSRTRIGVATSPDTAGVGVAS